MTKGILSQQSPDAHGRQFVIVQRGLTKLFGGDMVGRLIYPLFADHDRLDVINCGIYLANATHKSCRKSCWEQGKSLWK